MSNSDDTDVFAVPSGEGQPKPKKKEPPPYRVYAQSKVVVSKAMGALWRTKREAAVKTYEAVWSAWDEAFKYYNFNHTDEAQLLTPRGTFRRGDSTENIVYSNVNAMLPALFGQNPDITCSTTDEKDKAFCECVQLLATTLMRRRDKLNAKFKVKRATAFAMLTNAGILKLDYTLKDDSREVAVEALAKLTAELEKAEKSKDAEAVYGQIAALESLIEISKPSGPNMEVPLPHHLLIDPNAELPDGTDGEWMMEDVLLPTEMLKAKYTMKDEDGALVFVYKATHKAASLGVERGEDKAMAQVFHALDEPLDLPTEHTTEERLSYLYTYMTECVLVWDKITKRVMLFLKDDWSWPIWVWDDPLHLTRFFPYFVFGFGFSTGGVATVGEVAYYLDHQDEINDINRQVSRIRRSVFNYFYYNSRKLKKDEADKIIAGLRGESTTTHAMGIDVPEGMKMADLFESIPTPSVEYEKLFNKDAVLATVNRLTNTSDAFRGVQFKTNTNEKAVETYQDQVKMTIGAKVDVIEEAVADFALATIECCIQFMDKTEVEGLIGAKHAAAWRSMSVAEFNTNYSLELVAGSTEKPTSVYKQKQATAVAQTVGQFAQAAPGAAMIIMLKMLSTAFPEIIITDDDWERLSTEIATVMQQGISTGGAAPGGGAAPAAGASQQGQGQGGQIDELLAKAPPEVKERIAAAVQQGATPEQVMAMLQQATSGAGNANGGPTQGNAQNVRQ